MEVAQSLTRRKQGVKGRATTLYLSQIWNEYQRVVRQKLQMSGSRRLSTLMEEDLSRLLGQDLTAAQYSQRIRDFELQLGHLIVESRKIKNYLVKVGCYSEIEDSVINTFGLDVTTFKNVDSVIKKLISFEPHEHDNFGKDDLELMVSLLRILSEKMKIKSELDRLRLFPDADIASASNDQSTNENTSQPSNTEPSEEDEELEDFEGKD